MRASASQCKLICMSVQTCLKGLMCVVGQCKALLGRFVNAFLCVCFTNLSAPQDYSIVDVLIGE